MARSFQSPNVVPTSNFSNSADLPDGKKGFGGRSAARRKASKFLGKMQDVLNQDAGVTVANAEEIGDKYIGGTVRGLQRMVTQTGAALTGTTKSLVKSTRELVPDETRSFFASTPPVDFGPFHLVGEVVDIDSESDEILVAGTGEHAGMAEVIALAETRPERYKLAYEGTTERREATATYIIDSEGKLLMELVAIGDTDDAAYGKVYARFPLA